MTTPDPDAVEAKHLRRAASKLPEMDDIRTYPRLASAWVEWTRGYLEALADTIERRSGGESE